MARNWKAAALLAKIEGTYGVDPTLSGATDAILTKNVSIAPYDGPSVSRDLDRNTFGNDEQIKIYGEVTVSFDVEIAGSGSAVDDAPAYSPLLEACAWSAPVIDVGVDVRFTPINTSIKSVALEFYRDGQQHKVLGSRGNVEFIVNNGAIPYMRYTFVGLYLQPTAVANPALTLSGFASPLPVNNTNTPTFTLASYASCPESFRINMNNQVVHRNLPGCDEVLITNRSASSQMSFEAPTLAQHNYFADVESHNGVTIVAMSLVHGTTANNIFEMSSSRFQLSSLNESNSDDIIIYNVDASLVPTDAGNDELTLIIR